MWTTLSRMKSVAAGSSHTLLKCVRVLSTIPYACGNPKIFLKNNTFLGNQIWRNPKEGAQIAQLSGKGPPRGKLGRLRPKWSASEVRLSSCTSCLSCLPRGIADLESHGVPSPSFIKNCFYDSFETEALGFVGHRGRLAVVFTFKFKPP